MNRFVTRYRILGLLLTIAKLASATELDGLANLDIMLFSGLTGVVSVFVIIFSFVNRFAIRKNKVNKTLNISCTMLIICSGVALLTLGSEIDAGFLATCLVSIFISILLIVLNQRIGLRNQ